MDAKEKVLATMKEAGQPLNAGKIAELSCLDRNIEKGKFAHHPPFSVGEDS